MRNDRPPIRPAAKKTQNETIRAMVRATSDHISSSSHPAARIKEQLDRRFSGFLGDTPEVSGKTADNGDDVPRREDDDGADEKHDAKGACSNGGRSVIAGTCLEHGGNTGFVSVNHCFRCIRRLDGIRVQLGMTRIIQACQSSCLPAKLIHYLKS
ncbi:hypothetical protein C0Q70_18635 [Pomacea canaliculata]|uniref:Uncharacterized protein n=1 Tax=Pomacea canaliculata TaxID=400727 RepID=A0A2T7NH29_POMCA|nr:hypothetical protein C0Q70_18635 [Pomacea canaliculata]